MTEKLAELSLSNGFIVRCTPDHLFLSDGKWVKASELCGKHLTEVNGLLGQEKRGVICESVRIENTVCEVFDLTVEKDHSFIVAGVVVHNCDTCEFYDGHQYDENLDPVGDAPELINEPPLHNHCRCQLVAVDPDSEPLPKSTRLDSFLQATSPDAREAVFGKAAAKSYDAGDISASELLRASAGGHELSDDDLNEMRQLWDEQN
jgi:hypothetical protein